MEFKELSEHYKDTKENFYQYYGGKAEGLQLALSYFGNGNKQPMEEQEPAEWSEEDEIRLKEAIEVLDESIKYLPMGYGFIKDVNLVKNWLKSLRPQPHWKPSEDQIQELYNILQDPKKAGSISDRASIVGLIHDLKKLI